MKKLKEMWIRFWLKSPDYFARMKKWAVGLILLMAALNAAAPSIDFIVWTAYRGTEHEKTVWLSHIIAFLAAGIWYAAGQVVQDYGKLENQIKNKG